MYRLVNPTYGDENVLFDSVEDFEEMCLEIWGARENLTDGGNDRWYAWVLPDGDWEDPDGARARGRGHRELVLEPVADPEEPPA